MNTNLGELEAQALGLTQELLKAFPELQSIYMDFVSGNIARARMNYFNTGFYKNLTATAQSRQTTKTGRPGVYAQELDAWKQAQKTRLVQKGFPWNADIDALAEQAYLSGDSDIQFEIKILNSGKMGVAIGGSTLGVVNSLKEYANEQGLSNLLPKSYWEKVSTNILAGNLSAESAQEELKNFAISAYPAYAKGIQTGKSFNMQTSAARQMLANVLEKDIDSIGNDNPLFQKVVGYMNPKTGQPEQMPLWMVDNLARSTNEWLYTDNARNTFDNYALRVLRDMGVA